MGPASDDRQGVSEFWQRWLDGERVPAEEFLKNYPQLQEAPDIALDVICSEYMVRKSLGEQPDWEEFFGRFPHFATDLRQQFELHEAVEAIAEPDDEPQLEILVGEPFPRSGRFTLLRRLGGGGMGEVFEALDSRYGAHVALKILRNISLSAIERFRHEFRALTHISHPNLVTHYELFEEEGCWFLTMELIPGVDFLSFVRHGQLPPPDSAAVPAPIRTADSWRRLHRTLPQLANGLDTLHQHGIVHGDIKPSNVIVAPPDRVVLLDFGFAVSASPTRPSKTSPYLAATVRYAPPEQLAGNPAGPAGDCYSVGVMLCELLTGRSEVDSLDAPRPRPAESGENRVWDLCRQLLDHQPTARPTARALRHTFATSDSTQPSLSADPSRTGSFAGTGSQESPLAEKPLLDSIPPGRAAPKPFIGRDAELAALRAAAEAGAAGARLVLLSGPSGIGKTALLERFADQLREELIAQPLCGRCYQRESVSYNAFDAILPDLARLLDSFSPQKLAGILGPDADAFGAMFPALEPVLPHAARHTPLHPLTSPQRQRAFRAASRLIRALGDRAPVVICIDDVQWSDGGSQALLHALLRSDDPLRLLIVATLREGDPHAEMVGRQLAETAGPDAATRIPLEPLDAEQTRQLAERLLRQQRAPSGAADRIAQESRGVPILVEELSGLAGNDAAEVAGGRAVNHRDDIFRHRLVALPAQARELAQWVALSRHPLALSTLREFAPSADHLHRWLHFLVANRVLQWRRDLQDVMVDTYHDRIREALVAQLDAAEVRRLHERMVEVLERADRPNHALLALHTRGAGDFSRAARHAEQAAEAAARMMAFESAASYYRTALEWQSSPSPAPSPPEDSPPQVSYLPEASRESSGGEGWGEGVHIVSSERVHNLSGEPAHDLSAAAPSANATPADPGTAQRHRQASLYFRLADALSQAGRGAEAAEAYLQCARCHAADDSGDDPDRAAAALEARRLSGMELLRSGRQQQGDELLRGVLSALEGTRLTKDGPLRTPRLLLRLVGQSLRFKRFRATGAAPPPIDQLIDTYFLLALVYAYYDSRRSLDMLTRAAALAMDHGDRERVGAIMYLQSIFWVYSGARNRGRLARAYRHIRQRCGRTRDMKRRGYILSAYGWSNVLMGEWNLGQKRLRQADRCFQPHEGAHFEHSVLTFERSWALYYSGAWGELAAQTIPAVHDAYARGDQFAMAALVSGMTSTAWLAHDRPLQARRWCDALEAMTGDADYPLLAALSVMSRCQIDLYAGDSEAAMERIQRSWPLMRRSGLLRLQLSRATFVDLVARCAGAVLARSDPGSAALQRERARCIRKLRSERAGWVTALAAVLEAGNEPNSSRAVVRYREAAEACQRAGMRMHALACRLRAGHSAGDPSACAALEQPMRAAGVHSPHRTAILLLGPI